MSAPQSWRRFTLLVLPSDVELASALAGRTEARKPRRGVLEPLIAKLGRKRT